MSQIFPSGRGKGVRLTSAKRCGGGPVAQLTDALPSGRSPDSCRRRAPGVHRPSTPTMSGAAETTSATADEERATVRRRKFQARPRSVLNRYFSEFRADSSVLHGPGRSRPRRRRSRHSGRQARRSARRGPRRVGRKRPLKRAAEGDEKETVKPKPPGPLRRDSGL